MSKTIICCTSKQALPNFLVIKEFFEQGDTVCFITTDAFPDTDRLQLAMAVNGIMQTGKIIKIALKNRLEESISGMMSEFEKSFSDDKEYIVNLTGGTKLESLALFSFFQKKENARLVYVPFPNNYYIDFKDKRQVNFTKKADLKEFFTCYGINFSEDQNGFTFSDNGTYSKKLFSKYIQFDDIDFHFITDLRNTTLSEKKGGIRWEEIDKNKLKAFLKKIEFPVDFSKMTRKEREKYIKYIAGIWFEEYIKAILADTFNDVKISSGNIQASGNKKDNELDCVFIRNNKLVIIECKTMLGSDWIQGAVHKTSGIAETVKASGIKRYFFYINKKNSDNIEKTIHDAEEEKKAKFYGKEYFTDAEKFKEIIADIKRFTE